MRNMINSTLLLFMFIVFIGRATASESKPTILFDQGHNQRFLIEGKGDLDLSKLSEHMQAKGFNVNSTKGKLSDETFKNISGLVISGPFEALKSEEVDAVVRYVGNGGRLALMLHIGSPLSSLIAALDADHSNVVLHERKNLIDVDTNFRVTNLSVSPLFDGVTQFSTYGCWALEPGKNAVPIAMTSPESWADLDGDKKLSKGDVIGVFNVIVSGKYKEGNFLIFGDDAIFQNRYLDENNKKLASNLADWMKGK